jgi:hypothetical protein
MLVKLMDGEINVCSQVYKGSVFSVDLDLPMSTTVSPAGGHELVQRALNIEGGPFKGQVLLVECTDFN